MRMKDADALLEYLMINMGWQDEDGREVDDSDEKRAIIKDLIDGVPTIDAVPVEEIARLLADTFSSPCNFSPLDEEMCDVCGENCDMDDEKCWARWIKLKMDGERREDDAKEST